MKIQVKFKATEKSKEQNFVYTATNFFKILRIVYKAKRDKASAVYLFLE